MLRPFNEMTSCGEGERKENDTTIPGPRASMTPRAPFAVMAAESSHE